MKRYSALSLLLCCCLLPLNGCGSDKAESSEASSEAPVTAARTETTEPPMTTTVSLLDSGVGKAAAYLLNAGEMKIPAAEGDEKNGMLFRFTGVSAQSCTVTWDVYRITDFANGVGKALSGNGTSSGNVTCSYVPVATDSGTVTAFTLDGLTVTRNEANGSQDYTLAVDISGAEPQLIVCPADGGEPTPLTKFAPEMNEYEWVSFASAQETGDDAMGGESDLFSVENSVLTVDGSLFGSPQQEVETRIGYSIGTLQPFNEWAVPLQRAEFLYGGLDLELVFRDGSLTSVYMDAPLPADDFSLVDSAAAGATAKFGAAESTFRDENDNYVESWFLPEQNTTLYLYMVPDASGEGYIFRQQYTVGRTDRFCGF